MIAAPIVWLGGIVFCRELRSIKLCKAIIAWNVPQRRMIKTTATNIKNTKVMSTAAGTSKLRPQDPCLRKRI